MKGLRILNTSSSSRLLAVVDVRGKIASKKKKEKRAAMPRVAKVPKQAGSGLSTTGDTVDFQSFTNRHITLGLSMFDAAGEESEKRTAKTGERANERARREIRPLKIAARSAWN